MSNKRGMVVDDFLLNLDLFGFHPQKYDVKSLIKSTIIAILFTFTLLTLLVSLFRANNYEEFVESIEGLAPTYQGWAKMLAIVVFRKKWSNILDGLNLFWNWDRYGNDCEAIILKMQKNTRTLYKAFMVFSLFTLQFFNYHYTFSESDFAVFRGAICDTKLNDYCYWFYLVFTITVGNLLVLVTIGYDVLFIGVIVYCYCESKLIKRALIRLNDTNGESECFREYTEIIRHHSNILNIIKSLNDAVNFLLLSQFITTVLIVCVEFVFMTFAEHLPLVQDKIFLSAASFLQMGFYCFAGDMINEELTSIAEYYYNIDWWKIDKRTISRCIVIAVQRSQRNINLTIGGFVDLDLVTFTKILKFCMSLLTFLQTIFKSE